ncbi:uncharacterized protein LOC132711500 [Pantherophis guttatus]|nr:uncharacterized protein LOC132711500 [Pantherophis guttatus]XP_060546648.1 uncharacterized protein LOC132711500 [Pantherophis guttatus]
MSVLALSRLLGKMVSSFDIVPWSRLHSRRLQWFLLPFQRSLSVSSLRKVSLPSKVLDSLKWWSSSAIANGTLFREPHRSVLTTDASLSGWGAHLDSHMVQGLWTEAEKDSSINFLELRAIFLALRHFLPLLQGKHVLVLTDNVSAKAHVNRQGGTRSRSLFHESLQLGLWAETHLASLTASHISGKSNVQADSLSRNWVDHSEWQLHPDLFLDLSHRFGLPEVDLFASHSNHQVPRFLSRFPSPGTEAVDALRSPWPWGVLLYAFPPPASHRKGPQETPTGEVGADPHSSSLASPALVFGPGLPVHGQSMANTGRVNLPSAGGSGPPRAPVATVNRLETERGFLTRANIPPAAIKTIQAARRPSTARIYESTWRSFSSWCSARQVCPTSPSVEHVIGFLQEGFDSGLAPSTLRRQVAALASISACASLTTVTKDPLIRQFLRGASNLSPPVIHRFPTWDLSKVLSSLTQSPFEPLRTTSLKFLSFKVSFLVAITSARRISELAALSIRQDLSVFHHDKVVLRLDPTFLPKVNSVYH